MHRTSLFAAMVAVSLPLASHAQPPPPGQCFPACRPGFLCSPQGQCVSACNPACPSGQLCSPSGECVSACNPPCGAGETCTDTGQCVASAPVAPPPQPVAPPPPGAPPAGAPTAPPQPGYAPYGAQPPGLQLAPPMQPADTGWANGAGVYGLVASGVVAVLAIGAIAADDNDVSIPLGGVATAIAAISAPIVAVGAGSARGHPAVTGSPGLRVAGWVAYGLGIIDAIVILALAADDVDIPPAASSSVAALVVMSLLFHSLDALNSASEAEGLGGGAEGLVLTPVAAAIPDGEGGVAGLLGLGGVF